MQRLARQITLRGRAHAAIAEAVHEGLIIQGALEIVDDLGAWLAFERFLHASMVAGDALEALDDLNESGGEPTCNREAGR